MYRPFSYISIGDVMKRAVSVLLITLLLVFNFRATACAEELSLSAQAYVLYCVENGEVILSHNENALMKPASTTKIMTTLLALEACDIEDPIVEFDESMIAEGSSMYLKIGDTVHLSDLAVGMMMASGNDAANAVAITMSGNLENFSDLMNNRCREIGMKNTHFVTPSGLDDENHYSTAYDMALLMSTALENEAFCEITKNKEMTVSFLTPQKQVTYQNHNRLLSLYEYCIGGKTGYTKSAGRCLVSASRKDGVTLVCVTLNAPSDWQDHQKMYDYGFEKYCAIDSDDSKEIFTADVVGGVKDEVTLYTKTTDKAVVKIEDKDRVQRTVYLQPFLYAPIKSDCCVGMVVYTLDGEIIAQNPLYPSVDIDRQSESAFKRFLRRLF